jgi:hypothetical protein
VDKASSSRMLVALLAILCLPTAAQTRQNADDEYAAVVALEQTWDQAQNGHDARAMEMLLAETFEVINDDGISMNKSQWLAHIRSNVHDYELMTNTGLVVHLYGNVAIATGRYKERAAVRGKNVVHSGVFTDIWIQQEGQWQCVASQGTLVSH